MHVAIAHEWLTSYAGSERVVEQLLVAYPDAELLTTVAIPTAVPPAMRNASTSVLNRLPLARTHHEWFVPLMPLAWKSVRYGTTPDVVITSSHACSRAVRIPTGAVHVSYCHTPMRYAWDFASEKDRFPLPVRPLARGTCELLRLWDARRAKTADLIIANSTAVARRVELSYGVGAPVIHPPVDVEFFSYDPSTERDDFVLFAGRLVAYKRPDLVIRALTDTTTRVVVAGSGPLEQQLREAAGPNIEFVGFVSDTELRNLFRKARALIYPGAEDFGITMAEAMSCGCPVIAVDAGGARDLVIRGVNGVLMPTGNEASIRRGLEEFEELTIDHEAVAQSVRALNPGRFRSEIKVVVSALVG